MDAENIKGGQAPENLLWKSVPQVLPEGWTTEEKVLTVGESSSNLPKEYGRVNIMSSSMSMEEVATGSQIEQYLPEEYGGVNIMSLSVDAEKLKGTGSS